MEWIKFNETKPTEEYVLCLNFGYIPFVGVYNEKQKTVGYTTYVGSFTPDYWMPLPEPPKN